MASLIRDKNREGQHNGCRTLQFIGADRKRKSIRLGKVSAKAGESIKAKVESILAASYSQQSWDPETSAWIGKLDPKLYDKLAAAGLLPKRGQAEAATLGEFLDGYIASRTDVKPGTATVFQQTKKYMLEFFDAKILLADITTSDANKWRRWLAAAPPDGKGLAENTVRRRCGIARQFFREAVEARKLAENPFGKMKGIAVGDNRSRDYFITREEADKVLQACPSNEWRLIFALSRYGGLRCPSEHLGLTWRDVNWEQERITVRSPKTEHVAGRESRVIPLFPELRPYLTEAFEAAEDGAQFVIAQHRGSNVNLRTQLIRIIGDAGRKPWPKLFQNLRASRATELAADYPAHVAAEWLGHSTMIAQKHYWRTTDADFEKALHQCKQTAAVTTGKSREVGIGSHCDTADSIPLRPGTDETMSPAGLEPTTYGLKVRCSTN